MRANARTAITLLMLLGCAPLAACGGGEKNETKVQMKDMEVVDGTATDAMTDLDGVQSDGTAIVMPGNATNAATPARPTREKAEKKADADSEVLADQ